MLIERKERRRVKGKYAGEKGMGRRLRERIEKIEKSNLCILNFINRK